MNVQGQAEPRVTNKRTSIGQDEVNTSKTGTTSLKRNVSASNGTSKRSKTGRPIKHPRPADCPHLDRPEHKNNVCYQCSSNINNKLRRKRKDDSEQSRQQHEQPTRKRKASEYVGGTKRRKTSKTGNVDIVELNVGGEVFATLRTTLLREQSLLRTLVANLDNPTADVSGAFVPKYDANGCLFIDRDPTHFRWILNYLRDGMLVAVPENVSVCLEVLNEAKFYRLTGLCAILEYQQPGDLLLQSPNAPTFDSLHPPTDNIFYFNSKRIVWSAFFNHGICKPEWDMIAMRFEANKDEIVFMSLSMQYQDDSAVVEETRDIYKAKLDVRKHIAFACMSVRDENDNVETTEFCFWWSQYANESFSHLCVKIAQGSLAVQRELDCLRDPLKLS